MKVGSIALVVLASMLVVAALPIESDSSTSLREERAKKETAKLRLLDAVTNGRSNGASHTKEKPTTTQPIKEETKVTISRSESTSVPKTSSTTTPKSEFLQKLEKQRSIADQALRDRLRHSTPQKDQSHSGSAPIARAVPPGALKSLAEMKAASEIKNTQNAVTVPPVVYVPLSNHQNGQNNVATRFAPYVPASQIPNTNKYSRQSFWPFSQYFPIVINDPYNAFLGGTGGYFEYGQEADICKPSKPSRGASNDESSEGAQIAMEAGGYVTKMYIMGGGIAIAGPGGVATAGRGGTAIVGPGGTAYTSPGGVAVVGPGGKVVAHRKRSEGNVDGLKREKVDGRSDQTHHPVVVARGPVIYYDDSEDNKSEVKNGRPSTGTAADIRPKNLDYKDKEDGDDQVGAEETTTQAEDPTTKVDGVIESIPNATVLVLSPRAHARAGIGGTAIAKPLSVALLARKEDRVIYRPQVSAIAGPGGVAIALPELVIKKRWEEKEEAEAQKFLRRLEHRGGDVDIQSAGDGEVVEASEFVSANAGDKSVAQAQPVGIATAGLGGVAVSQPQGVAVVGPGGLAISRPIAVAVAGPGADSPGIFLNPEGVGPTEDEDSEDNMEGPPEVEEANEEEEKPPVAMFYQPPYAPQYVFFYPVMHHYPIY